MLFREGVFFINVREFNLIRLEEIMGFYLYVCLFMGIEINKIYFRKVFLRFIFC